MFRVADDGVSVVRMIVVIDRYVFDAFQHLITQNYGAHHLEVIITYPNTWIIY